MTKKITDLEGRLNAAFARSKPVLPTGFNVIGRYRILPDGGVVRREIIFGCTLNGEALPWVTWVRNLNGATRYGGHYFGTFREGLKDFLERISDDGRL